MEWVQLFVESYVKIIQSLVWPITIFVILFIFRRPIMDKLQGLTKVGIGGTQLEFIPKLRKPVIKRLKLSKIKEDNLTWNNYLDVLEDVGYWIDVGISLLFIAYVKEVISKEDFEKMYQVATKQIDDIDKKIETERTDSTVLKEIRENQIKLKEKIELFERFKSKPKRSRADRLVGLNL